ncbi:hypothetical protein P5673_033111 [Acropora cervicornis]|uniref:Uncharacterized protein n=1 Tax=Acropora cervicornis TaxID=6130 RepID=A0AAD9PQE5_ACRCE|nr:hypothetical protein P5673_033111 [Acropora cervicornis]
MIDRCVYGHVCEEVLECSLHGFADASKKAYCAVIYFLYRTKTGTYSKMLTSKTRVARLKELSIPRLELIACLILAKLMCTVKNALNSQVSVQKVKFWSDSMTALYWIMNYGEWKQFVSHRVNEIVKLSEKENWGHCPSEQNPADIGSRGSLAVELKGNEMWWRGPSWLIQPEDLWPRQKSLVPTTETCEEERKVAVMTIAIKEPCGIEKVLEISKFNALRKLYRVTAWVTRFCHNISRRNKSDRREGPLTLEEMVESEELWIRAAQRELRKGGNYQQLVSKFGLHEDQKGVRRWTSISQSLAARVVMAQQDVIIPERTSRGGLRKFGALNTPGWVFEYYNLQSLLTDTLWIATVFAPPSPAVCGME